ncbi:glutenin, high molecular weight subunit PW212-like [Marmota marmota marmota]|uniref:glutenin, high molecular weight subunit PW212-like n=1 Tax=Marmota marmota marmota TaxID=9994 RepID=UPI00209341AE|nr:glutenin, high molecular weight subunit PW212-like [Marmota marmota marmota]
MGLCFALPLAALASCLLPADCCITCDQAVMGSLRFLKENYIPGHLDVKNQKKVIERVDVIAQEFKEIKFKNATFLGTIDEKTLKKASQSVVKEMKRITDSNVKGDQFVRELYRMLHKEKAKFTQYAADFQNNDYCPNKCGMMMQRLLWCPECRIGNYRCWKSLDCGERLVKIHEKENLTLNCLFKWHLIAQELTDYKFERIWEDGSETLLYKGKNPMLTITSLTQKNTGTYRCELGTETSGPSTIIHFLVTVLPPNATEETPTTSILFGSETESGTQGANVTGETSPAVPGGTGPASPTVQGETGPGVQGETGPGVQSETAPLQGETGPTEQGEMGPFQEDTGSTEQGETAPLQDGMGSLAQGEMAPQVQGETGPPVQGETGPPVQGEKGPPVQGEMTSPDLVETAPVQAETAPLEAETAPLEAETAPLQGETTLPAQGETTQSAQGETTQPFQVETAPLQGEMAPGEGETASQFQGETNQVETALLEEETAPLQGEMAPGEGETASEVQGEAAPPNQVEMAPFEEETEPGEIEMGQPLQNEMAPGQGEMTPPEQVDTAPLQGEMTPPGQAETAQFQGEMATPVHGETSAAQGETASPIQAWMAQLQNEAALVQDETAPFLGETAPLLGDMAPLEETSVRPNPGELESSTTNQQPEQAKGVQQGRNLGLIIALPLLLILGLILW